MNRKWGLWQTGLEVRGPELRSRVAAQSGSTAGNRMARKRCDGSDWTQFPERHSQKRGLQWQLGNSAYVDDYVQCLELFLKRTSRNNCFLSIDTHTQNTQTDTHCRHSWLQFHSEDKSVAAVAASSLRLPPYIVVIQLPGGSYHCRSTCWTCAIQALECHMAASRKKPF